MTQAALLTGMMVVSVSFPGIGSLRDRIVFLRDRVAVFGIESEVVDCLESLWDGVAVHVAAETAAYNTTASTVAASMDALAAVFGVAAATDISVST